MKSRRSASSTGSLGLAFSLLVLAGAALHITACGSPSPNAVCQKSCDCVGCSKSARDSCVSEGDIAQKKASDAGCSNQFNAYLACIEQSAQCTAGTKFDVTACVTEEKALSTCGVSAPGGNPCAKYAADVDAKVAECNLGTSSGTGTPSTASATCSGQVAVLATCADLCVLNVSCAGLSGQDTASLKTYVDCVTTCAPSNSSGSGG